MAGITHGFGGWCKIGSVYVLSRPGAQFSMPRALDIPYPVSYQPYGYLNVADGLRFPVLSLPAIPMNSASPWFTGTLLNAWFMTRSAMPAFDLSAITNGIEFSDNGVASGAGLGSFKVLAPKGAGWTLNVDKGQPVGFMMRFAGTDRDSSGLTAPAAGLAGAPVEFDAVTLGGNLASKGIIGVSLNFDTGLTPNMELNTTLRPSEQNAGLATATLTIRMNAVSGVDAPGWSADPTAYTDVAGTISIARASGVGNSVVFSITRAILQNPDDRRQGQGRMIREYTYNCIASISAPPITIADV